MVSTTNHQSNMHHNETTFLEGLLLEMFWYGMEEDGKEALPLYISVHPCIFLYTPVCGCDSTTMENITRFLEASITTTVALTSFTQIFQPLLTMVINILLIPMSDHAVYLQQTILTFDFGTAALLPCWGGLFEENW